MKKLALFIAATLSAFLMSSAAQASCPGYPYTLTNGTTADASQVMGNFTYIQGCAAPLASPSFTGNVGIGTASPATPAEVPPARLGPLSLTANTFVGVEFASSITTSLDFGSDSTSPFEVW